MSTPPPPGQPGPSPYQNPQQPGGAVPPQYNPYAQSAPGYGPPQQPGYYGVQQIPAQPGGTPGGTGTGAVGRAVLWAAVGAAVASALWGGGVVLFGKDSAKADLRGYTVHKKLCDTADLSAFKDEYPKPDEHPTSYLSDRASLAQMYCSESLDKDDDDDSSSSGYSYAYVSVQADLHRRSDPGPEFADQWKSFADRGTEPTEKYDVTPVDGYGDEAYLITQDSTTSATGGSREVTLAVRDGWMTYSLTWNGYASTAESEDNFPSLDKATGWVEAATKATLPKLK